MIEYEYSIKAESIEPFVEYCKKNGFKLISVANENRMVFENKSNRNLISRITITEMDGKKTILFDFKNKTTGDEAFKVAQESLPLKLQESEIEIAKSMLSVLEFEQTADNLRTRYVYQKEGVEFEIDEYTRPKMNVIGIEGEKEKVDKVYKDLRIIKEIEKVIIK